jgi:hypothetical protein
MSMGCQEQVGNCSFAMARLCVNRVGLRLSGNKDESRRSEVVSSSYGLLRMY